LLKAMKARGQYRGYRRQLRLLFALLLIACVQLVARDLTLAELKGRLASTRIAERPALCLEISERELDAADQLYAAGDNAKAEEALGDVAVYSELARDYAIQSHKHEKQSEIAVRKMARKLADLKHTVTHEEQKGVQDAIDRLERVRDDLLAAMFPNGGKKR